MGNENQPYYFSDSHFHLEFRLRLGYERLVLRNGQVDLAEHLIGNTQGFAPAVERHTLALWAALDRAVRPGLSFFGFLVGVHAPEREMNRQNRSSLAVVIDVD